jgi:hypothetical protein
MLEYGEKLAATNPSQEEWISVEDGLPEVGIYLVYLVGYGEQPEIVKAKLNWSHGYWVHIGGYGTIDEWITHYRPLPAPPLQTPKQIKEK